MIQLDLFGNKAKKREKPSKKFTEKEVIEDCIRRGIINENEYIEGVGKARLQFQVFLSEFLPMLTEEEKKLFAKILKDTFKRSS